MSETQELREAQKSAMNLANVTNVKELIPRLENIGVDYVNGKPRMYYKTKGGKYYYRDIDMHRRMEYQRKMYRNKKRH